MIQKARVISLFFYKKTYESPSLNRHSSQTLCNYQKKGHRETNSGANNFHFTYRTITNRLSEPLFFIGKNRLSLHQLYLG